MSVPRLLRALALAALAGLAATPQAGAQLAAVQPRSAQGPVALDEIKIAVNNKSLTRREVEQVRSLQTQELRRQFQGDELEARLKALDKDLTNTLIDDLLLESYAESLKLDISDQTIEERVDAILRRQPNLQDLYTDEQLKAFVLRDLLRGRVLAREVDSRIRVGHADVVAACHKQGRENREVEVGHILIRGEEAGAREKLLGLRKALEGGADFEKLAVRNSEDPSVASNKGRLGYISRGQFVKSFEDVAFSLRVGEVSEPVKTRFGLHLIKVFAERSKDPVDCEHLSPVARQALENELYTRQREEQLERFMARIRKQAEIRVLN